jgi:transglutaminase-like putative cysteine protease
MSKQLFLTFYFFIINLFFLQVLAQKVQINATPDWLVSVKYSNAKVNNRQISDGYYYKLSESQSHVEKKQHYIKQIRTIVTSDGVQNASEVYVNFSPSYEKLRFHTLKINRKGLIINKLKSDTFQISPNETESSKFLYNGLYTARAILADVRIGDEIEYSYTIEGRNPVFGDKYFCDIYLSSGTPVGQYYTNFICDSGRKLYSKSFNNAQAPKISTIAYEKIHEWNINNLIPLKLDNYLPKWIDTEPHIQFSEYKNWAEVVKWSLEVQKNTNPLSASLKKEIETLKNQAKGNQNKLIELATRMVQNEIRYTGIETGVHSHKPHSPSQVFAQKYGDCKDKSLLLASILQSCGIEANLVNVDTYWGKNLDKYLPSPSLFNHVVLQTKLDGIQFFIDPTFSNQGGSIKDNYFPDYGKGLIIAPGIDNLTEFPKSNTGINKVLEEYWLGMNGKTTYLNVESKYTLNYADYMRASLAQTSFVDLEQGYIDFYQNLYKGSIITLKDSIQVIDDPLSNELTIKESYIITDNWSKPDSAKNIYTTQIYAYYLKNLLPNIDKTVRKNPIAFSYPNKIEYSAIVHFSSQLSLAGEKWKLNRKAYACDFESYYTSVDSTFTQNFNFESKQDFIEIAQAAEYLTDFEKIVASSGSEYSWDMDLDLELKNDNINWFALISFILLTVGLVAIYFIKLYPKNAKQEDEYPYAPDMFGGWLVIPLIGLCLSPFLVIVQLFSGDGGLFIKKTWFSASHINNLISGQVFLSIEFVMNAIFMANMIFIIALFLKKRDTLPTYIIWMFYASHLLMMLLDLILVKLIGQDLNDAILTELFKSTISAVIWISYFRLSKRVKRTFVNRYQV